MEQNIKTNNEFIGKPIIWKNRIHNRTEWLATLDEIRKATHHLETAETGFPTVAANVELYELIELIKALTTGYNALISLNAKQERKLNMLRRIVDNYFMTEQRRKEGKL